jgi:hypothetical protein
METWSGVYAPRPSTVLDDECAIHGAAAFMEAHDDVDKQDVFETEDSVAVGRGAGCTERARDKDLGDTAWSAGSMPASSLGGDCGAGVAQERLVPSARLAATEGGEDGPAKENRVTCDEGASEVTRGSLWRVESSRIAVASREGCSRSGDELNENKKSSTHGFP